MDDKNLPYLIGLIVVLGFLIFGVVYIAGRQDECVAKNAILVRNPLGWGFSCVAVKP